MNTLVRGQKLPVFSGPGLPGLELAARIVEWARAPRGKPFAVVFAAVGITARESREFVERIEQSGAMPRTVLYLNEASHPAVERLLAPRLALTCAEFLAFERGVHVLVVIADMTHYCEALREIATAREGSPDAAATRATCTRTWPRSTSAPGSSADAKVRSPRFPFSPCPTTT